MTGFDLLDRIKDEAAWARSRRGVHGQGTEPRGGGALKLATKSIVVKGARSPERLLDETALFLHRAIDKLPPAKQKMLESLHMSDDALQDRKVLVVDDDVRNIFALSSVLERHGMHVQSAINGEEAIARSRPARRRVVLMDIMMPEMDGYETRA
jgi:PleD family two-component response regulator